MLKIAAERKREKDEEKAAKARILEQIRLDKEARKAKEHGSTIPEVGILAVPLSCCSLAGWPISRCCASSEGRLQAGQVADSFGRRKDRHQYV